MFKNLPGLLIGTILLILGFMFSIVIISIIALIGLGFWSYFWWKTRALRQGMQKHMPRQESDGQIIDGEAIIVDEYQMDTKKTSLDNSTRQ